VHYPDARLHLAAPPQPGVDAALRGIGERLLQAARDYQAYGLAAAHIGEIAPVVVIGNLGEPRDHRLLYNPRITGAALLSEKGEEGSVSLPGVRVEIERPIWVEIDYMDGAGETRQTRLDGFLARVAMHEIEQMGGVFFLDKVSRLKRDMAVKRARKR
jgi:peptide deformylase